MLTVADKGMHTAPIGRSEVAMFNKRTLESLCSSFLSLKAIIINVFKIAIVGEAVRYQTDNNPESYSFA